MIKLENDNFHLILLTLRITVYMAVHRKYIYAIKFSMELSTQAIKPSEHLKVLEKSKFFNIFKCKM